MENSESGLYRGFVNQENGFSNESTNFLSRVLLIYDIILIEW